MDTNWEQNLAEWSDSQIRTGDDGETVVDQPEDTRQAAGIAASLARHHRARAEIADLANWHIEQVRSWQQDRTAGVDRAIRALERALGGWMTATDRKTWNTPAGVARLTAPKPRVVIDDEAALVRWATEHGHADRLLRVVYKPAVRDGLDQLGRKPNGIGGWSIVSPDGDGLIPGAQVLIAEGPSFSFRPAGEY